MTFVTDNGKIVMIVLYFCLRSPYAGKDFQDSCMTIVKETMSQGFKITVFMK